MILKNPSRFVDYLATLLFEKGIIKELYFIFDYPLTTEERGFDGIKIILIVSFIGIFLISFSSANSVEGHVYVTVVSDPAHAETISYSESTFICRGWKLQGNNVKNMTLKVYNSSGSLIFSETNETLSNEICQGNDGIMDYNFSCLNYSFDYTLPYEDNFQWSCEACDDYESDEYAPYGHCRTTENQTIGSDPGIEGELTLFPDKDTAAVDLNQSNDARKINETNQIRLNKSKKFGNIPDIKLNTFWPLLTSLVFA